MSVRVVSRIRPVAKAERDSDAILSIHDGPDGQANRTVKLPNPKNLSEEFSFTFNNVFGPDATQQDIFEQEVAPTVKHLFAGFDVTIFAYGSTGTGKTHTMRGGKTLADRGMIPRLLSNIYRKSRALEKAGDGDTTVDVSMSYYEIYNDRVYDLFEAPEKRNAVGLPIREAEGGKTVVVGLTETPCGSLKDFEALYDMANANRSVGATKLNAHSSRSHAVLVVKLAVATPSETRVSNASCIDLAGSEDNRRTGNGKDRMVESASINKSLFTLAQCVEAISKKHHRIPYRESKMTRILSLGQNNGFTLMILNLAPVRSFHLDTLSSLNFANRTKKIEVREVENEPIFRGPPRPVPAAAGPNIQRQPLRPIAERININLSARHDMVKSDKPAKAFSVYSDRGRPVAQALKPRSPKRPADSGLASARPAKMSRPTPSFIRRGPEPQPTMSKATIESLVEAKVSEILASRALAAPEPVPAKQISEEVQRRLDSIEKRLEGQEGERAEGLSYLFMAKQHQARGEDVSALKMYELAQPYFPGNEKLDSKIARLRERIARKRDEQTAPETTADDSKKTKTHHKRQRDQDEEADRDESYHASGDEPEDDDERPRARKPVKPKRKRASSPDPLADQDVAVTPRTQYLIDIINSRDPARIRSLAGVGAKKADSIVEFMNGNGNGTGDDEPIEDLRCWRDLSRLKGVGRKTLEQMREGVVVAAVAV